MFKIVRIGLVSKNFSAINNTLIQLFFENMYIGLISLKKSCISAINHAWNEKHSKTMSMHQTFKAKFLLCYKSYFAASGDLAACESKGSEPTLVE